MIVIPAIIVAIVEAAVIGGLAGAVICGMEDRRTLPSDAPKELRTAHKCAVEGALVGGIFSGGFYVAGVAIGGVSGAVDDFALPAFNTMDDAARYAARARIATSLDDLAYQAVDDLIKPTGALDNIAKPAPKSFGRIRQWFGKDLNAPLRLEANIERVSFFKSLRLPKNANPKAGFTYVVKVENVSSKNLYKIGYTRNPLQRLKRIQYDLNKSVGGKVKFTCIIPTKNILQLESAMHAAFDAQRIHNFAAGTEFFHLNPAQLAAACSY